MRKSLKTFCWDFQFRVVQRCDNLVDLDKCCKMSIYLERLVPIQPRTSPLKFDHLVEKFEVKNSIVSFNLAKNILTDGVIYRDSEEGHAAMVVRDSFRDVEDVCDPGPREELLVLCDLLAAKPEPLTDLRRQARVAEGAEGCGPVFALTCFLTSG